MNYGSTIIQYSISIFLFRNEGYLGCNKGLRFRIVRARVVVIYNRITRVAFLATIVIRSSTIKYSHCNLCRYYII